MKHIAHNTLLPFDFKGLKIREMTPDELKSASVAEIEVPIGITHPLARSSKSDKLYICTEGQVSFQINNQDISLNPKDLLLIQKGEWFTYRNNNANTARLILVHIPPFNLECEEFAEE
jgi:mannose-6-phosphate isomerase-like protein (cupin superfamily)